MYERFTDRARRILQLAQTEAKRFNHEYIGTEHILLGLIKEGGGVGAVVLENLGVRLSMVREEVEKIIQTGPEIVIMGKLPQTPRAKSAIQFAVESAKELRNNYVGSEHLLLGLILEGNGVACQIFKNLGVKLERVKEAILQVQGRPVEVDTPAVVEKDKPATMASTVFPPPEPMAWNVTMASEELPLPKNVAEVVNAYMLASAAMAGRLEETDKAKTEFVAKLCDAAAAAMTILADALRKGQV